MSRIDSSPHLGRRKVFAAFALAAVLGAPPAGAQAPVEPVRLVIGFPAGSSTDVTARLLAARMQLDMKRTVLVENKPGASGRIAVDAVRASRPDGATLLFAPHGPMTLFPHVFRRLSYDPVRDFVPVSQVVTFDFALFSNASLPVSNIQDLKAWSDANPGKATYGSPGIGTTPHFLATALAYKAGMKLTHVPFASPPQIMSSLVGGHLALSMGPLDEGLPFMKDGKVKALGTSGAVRSPVAPQIPTFKEQGIDLELIGWFGLYAPAGTAPSIVAEYEHLVRKALADPEVKARLAAMNMKPAGTSGAELARIREQESAMWADVVKATGFTPEN